MAQSRHSAAVAQPGFVALVRAHIPLLVIFLCGVLVYISVLIENPYMDPDVVPDAQTPDATQSQGEQDPQGTSVVPAAPAEDQVLRGEFTSTSQSIDPNRSENIRLAAEAVNGTVVEPGKVFSFNKIIGNTSKDKRYQLAPVLNGYKFESGRGGGICQVSSAIYVAALYADLEIVERHPHTVVTDYVAAGLDATVLYSAKMDLRIRNSTDKPITLSVEVSAQAVVVRIFGEALENGKTVNTTTKLISYNVTRNSKTGADEVYCTFAAYRIFYKDGVETSREYLSTDVYLDSFSEVDLSAADSGGRQYAPTAPNK